MTRDEFDALCSAHPGAVLSGQGELDAWKVGGKMFAWLGHSDRRETNIDAVSVKCADADTAEMLIEAGAAKKAAYFHRSWVSLDLPSLQADEARHRIAQSYDAVARSLPKKMREAL